jgi:hypothetical protein
MIINPFIDLGKLTSLEMAALASITIKASDENMQKYSALANIARAADCLAGDEYAADVEAVDEFFGN